MPEEESSPDTGRLADSGDTCDWERPNWGWGSREPVPMFTEAEIRAACTAAKLLDQETDALIEALKDTRAHHIGNITP